VPPGAQVAAACDSCCNVTQVQMLLDTLSLAHNENRALKAALARAQYQAEFFAAQPILGGSEAAWQACSLLMGVGWALTLVCLLTVAYRSHAAREQLRLKYSLGLKSLEAKVKAFMLSQGMVQQGAFPPSTGAPPHLQQSASTSVPGPSASWLREQQLEDGHHATHPIFCEHQVMELSWKVADTSLESGLHLSFLCIRVAHHGLLNGSQGPSLRHCFMLPLASFIFNTI
jgi:hypothetical protein